MKHSFALIACLALVVGCALPESAYKNPGQPEALLDKSAERVSFSLAPKTAIADLTAWVDKDQPTRAELSCSADNLMCQRAEDVLRSFAVPFKHIAAKQNSSDIVLVYERITARKCDNSYIDNRHNFRNLHHPAFGCSVASNIMQTISNPQQIINPALSGLRDAEKAVQDVDAYHNSAK